jgi:YD repeat-containing protein
VLNEFTTVGGTTRSHDGNGNLTDDGTYKFGYDFENRLVELRNSTTNALIASYRYDALGRRVEKAINGGATTRYVLDGVQVVEEFDGSNAWQARYVYEDGIDQPRCMDRPDIADVNGNSNTTEVLRFHYHQQALGSVTELTQPTGAVVEWVTYDVYGLPTIRNQVGATVTQSAVGNPWLFTGREFDAESGLYFSCGGHFCSGTGRPLQRRGGEGWADGDPSEGILLEERAPEHTLEIVVQILIHDPQNTPRPDADEFAPLASGGRTVAPGAAVAAEPSAAQQSVGIYAIRTYVVTETKSNGDTHTIYLFQVFVEMPPTGRDEWARKLDIVLGDIVDQAGYQVGSALGEAEGTTAVKRVPTRTMALFVGHGNKAKYVPWAALSEYCDTLICHACDGASQEGVEENAWHVGEGEALPEVTDPDKKGLRGRPGSPWWMIEMLLNNLLYMSVEDAIESYNRDVEKIAGLSPSESEQDDDSDGERPPFGRLVPPGGR